LVLSWIVQLSPVLVISAPKLVCLVWRDLSCTETCRSQLIVAGSHH
jgi:hypothetical protein